MPSTERTRSLREVADNVDSLKTEAKNVTDDIQMIVGIVTELRSDFAHVQKGMDRLVADLGARMSRVEDAVEEAEKAIATMNGERASVDALLKLVTEHNKGNQSTIGKLLWLQGGFAIILAALVGYDVYFSVSSDGVKVATHASELPADDVATDPAPTSTPEN